MQYPRKAGMERARVNTSIVAVSSLLNVYEPKTRERAIDRCFSLSLSPPLLELARNFHPSDSAKIFRANRGSNNGGAPGIIFSLRRGSEYVLFSPADKRVYTRVTSIHDGKVFHEISICNRRVSRLIPVRCAFEISGPLSRWTFFERELGWLNLVWHGSLWTRGEAKYKYTLEFVVRWELWEGGHFEFWKEFFPSIRKLF